MRFFLFPYKNERSIDEMENTTKLVENKDTQILKKRLLLIHALPKPLIPCLIYRYWAESTRSCYKADVRAFEEFMFDNNLDVNLGNVRIHIVQKWINHQRNKEVSIGTIKRRVASLSSIFEFYKNIGIIHSNPFKAANLPEGAQGHHSAVMDFYQLEEVYQSLQDFKKEGTDIEVTVKVMLFTGLRNEALSKLKVENVLMDKELLHYDAGIQNSKHKIQFFPLPPGLFTLLKKHIEQNNLQAKDSLLFGLKGQPLQNKQVNRITDKICKRLGWNDDATRVTPHGFRSSISTLLDEREINLDAIKYLLGHSNTDNIHHYLRRDQRKIHLLRKELTTIEEELENSLLKATDIQSFSKEDENEEINKQNEPIKKDKPLMLSTEALLNLLDSKPEVAIALIEKGYGSLHKATF